MRDFRIFGHRGAAGHAPENTRASIEKAIALDLQWIEVDVRFVCEQLIVFHDRRLERLCSQVGTIDDITAQQLSSLRVGGEPLLTLDALMEILPKHMGVNLEIKGQNTADTLCYYLKNKLNSGLVAEHQLLLSSFDHAQLFSCKQLLPNVNRGLLMYGVSIALDELIDTLAPISVHQSIDFVNKELVKQCQLLGKKLYVYTVNEIDDIKRMIELGVDGVFSDYPDRIEHYLKNNT